MTINSYAFSGCTALVSIVIPEGVATVKDSAFSRCTSLIIYCEAAAQPEAWSTSWNPSNRPVYWGYIGEEYVYTFVSNGREEPESITSSTAIALPELTLDGYVFLGWFDNELLEGAALPSIFYAGKDVTLYAGWMTEEEYNALHDGSSFERAIIATAGQTYTVNVSVVGQVVYYVFVPETTKSYTISSASSLDTYGTLYSASHSELTHSDDNGGDRDFSISYSLTAGNTYYIAVKLYASTATGTFTISIK